MEMQNVSLIGSGNLAWHIAPELDNAGYPVKEVYSRNAVNAGKLVNNLYDAIVKKDLDFSGSPSSIFIIAVTDDAIKQIAMEIAIPENAVLVHTSGGQPLSTLGYAATSNIGVFYPLQTFSKNKKVNFKEVPICIETETSEAERILHKMASQLSKNVVKIDSQSRKSLHVAAVFASNFTNHMITLSKGILSNAHLNFDLLKPLIKETIEKSLIIGPENAQTGPALRKDVETLEKHLEYLEEDEAYSTIYKMVTQHIMEYYDV